MIKGIHHTAISTGDFERALAFYRDLLGFEMVSELNWPAGVELADTITGLEGSAARSVMLRASNTSIELFEFASPTPKPGDPKRPVCDHGITHIGFEVDDIDAEYERGRHELQLPAAGPGSVEGDLRSRPGRQRARAVAERRPVVRS